MIRTWKFLVNPYFPSSSLDAAKLDTQRLEAKSNHRTRRAASNKQAQTQTTIFTHDCLDPVQRTLMLTCEFRVRVKRGF